MRRTQLRRNAWMRHSSKRSSYARRPRDTEHMLAVKSLPCVAHDLGGCFGRVQADHAGARGLGQKCSDREVIAICEQHHLQRATFAGPFKGWSREVMRAWLVDKIAETQAMLDARRAA